VVTSFEGEAVAAITAFDHLSAVGRLRWRISDGEIRWVRVPFAVDRPRYIRQKLNNSREISAMTDTRSEESKEFDDFVQTRRGASSMRSQPGSVITTVGGRFILRHEPIMIPGRLQLAARKG
jgi:hypothetical protein